MKSAFLLFLALQVGDFLTTVAALRLGAAESNPVLIHLMTGSPLTGLFLAKLFALAIGAVCVLAKKYRAIRISNVAFSGIVAWNMAILVRLW